MCGIVGLISKQVNGFFLNDIHLFSQLLVADSVRGTDGTGVFGTYCTGSVAWAKVGAHPFALLNSKKFESFSQAMTRKMDMVVGHNRKGTSGNVSNDNAHPFVHEHIILVHNGSVYNHKSMAETEVDSHAIAHEIVNKGYQETLKNLNGAFTLVWFDMKDRMLRIVRNSERPLCMVETDTQIAFASEGYMLHWIGERNNKNWKDVKSIEEGVLISISQQTKKLVTEKVELYKPNAWSYQSEYGYCGYPGVIYEDCVSGNDEVEDPIAAAIRADSLELGEDDSFGDIPENDVVKAFLEKYKEGSTVTFAPTAMTPWSSAAPNIVGWNIVGDLREDATVQVRASFEGADQKATVERLFTKKVLKGTVFGVLVSPSTNQKSLHVNFVTDLQMYRAFNGTYLTSDEWISICDKYVCTRCRDQLKIKNLSKTSVNIKGSENVRVFCPECVKKKLDTLPPEQRESLIATNVALLKQHTEKEWNLKGAAHGS